MTLLWGKMQVLASTPRGQFRADELKAKAAELKEKAEGYFGEPQTVTPQIFLGAWARARRVYCDVSGESLV